MSGPVPEPDAPFPASAEDGPKIYVLAGAPANQYTLRYGSLLLGRLAEADFQIDHPEISRYHCKVHWDGANAQLEDLGSRRGTRVNGTPLPKGAMATLRPGDRIEVGPVILQFAPSTPPAPSAVAPGSVPRADGVGSSPAVGPSRVLMGGREVQSIPLRSKITFGRANECDVVLNDAGVSRQHASIEPAPTGYLVTDLRSRGGSFVNGHRFERHELVIGDQLQIGPFFFRFDGVQLVRARGGAGVTIEGQRVTKQVGTLTILDNVNIRIERGQFVCILGPSGSGKSTLLDAITGLRPATGGTVLYDGMDLIREYDQLRSMLGYVPQDDIVHPELTVRMALLFSAKLRLPAGTPIHEIEKLVDQTILQLGLSERANIPIGRLSGGQRKRVSVGVELLGRPSVLFLDEPTSGLDPAAEFKMMELLRHLADGGCTVVCTTHLMENVYLADKLFVIAQGKLVFSGGPQEARNHFGVQKLTALYDRLAERPAAEWERDFKKMDAERALETAPSPFSVGQSSVGALPVAATAKGKPSPALPILLLRQWAILTSDIKNFLILFGQPVVIGLLVSWVTNESSLCLFFAYLSALWFGCSNSAQEIVKEIAIYRRERMVGLGQHSYLLSKFFLVGSLTALQSLLLYLVLQGGHYAFHDIQPNDAKGHEFLMGLPIWQAGALVGISLAAVGVGLAISALSRTAMQAVMVVPLALIPQILFSGLVVKASEMKSSAYAVTRIVPSYAAQTIMDLSCFHNERITGDLNKKNYPGFEHVSFLNRRETGERLKSNAIFNAGLRGWLSGAKLLVWTMLGYAVAFFGLRTRERG
ncbi:MAG: FHA domain-containing protein [Verrucomicrobia bacterium]|nr:FHA domain-containing protein [Verrucomicrobiota bacterium]